MLEKSPDPEHVSQLEATVRQLSAQVDQLSGRLAAAEAEKAEKPEPSPGGGEGGSGGGGAGGGGGGEAVGQVGPVTSSEVAQRRDAAPDAEATAQGDRRERDRAGRRGRFFRFQINY